MGNRIGTRKKKPVRTIEINDHKSRGPNICGAVKGATPVKMTRGPGGKITCEKAQACQRCPYK